MNNNPNFTKRRFFIIITVLYLILLYFLFQFTPIMVILTLGYVLLNVLLLNTKTQGDFILENVQDKIYAKDPSTVQMLINKGGKIG